MIPQDGQSPGGPPMGPEGMPMGMGGPPMGPPIGPGGPPMGPGGPPMGSEGLIAQGGSALPADQPMPEEENVYG